ncbi:hypothetical protein Q5A52_000228 [Staphylococcus aureus]|nr:hypothetical protein [Staphylococcus aureus]KAJ46713.1 hypothetical protein HMPREF1625_02051 [Staphylococcus aureus 880]KIE14749.1 hypothetical protein HMPREF2111_02048 [Staphylococcus aureus 917]ELL5624572.1 hypothetical protein [Staphylococcus aureus]HCU7475245.1 hypothetical protein [Staphylococcus aureus]HDB1462549.1 hypothetical protein [Staphylococcus aureus]
MYNAIYIGSSWRGPNTEAGGKSANNIVQVRAGPQHKEKLFPLEIITST